MGSDICIGMRRKSGEIISALSYSHVFGRILIEADLVTPNEDELAVLIREYRDRQDYGPLPVAPIGSGLLFFDFVSGTIFDGQSISWFPAFQKDHIVRALLERPERFDVYVPHFDRILSFGNEEDINKIPPIVSKTFQKAADRSGLWTNAGIETVPGVKSRYENGEEIVLARAMVPSKGRYDADFLALMPDLPHWTIRSIDPCSSGDWADLRVEFDRLGLLSAESAPAWDSHLADMSGE
jgi:hypothetical protein